MTTELITLPHSTDAEQAVIGSILLNSQSEASQKTLAMLKPEFFYSRAHQIMFSEMREMDSKHLTVDGLTLHDQLANKGILEQIGGFAYIAQISKNTPSAANIKAYASVVRDCAMKRHGIAKANQMLELFYAKDGQSVTEKFDQAQSIFAEMSEYTRTGTRKGARALIDVMHDWLDEVDQRFSSDKARGLSTGIQSLDNILEPKGLVKGSLLVIGGRPKMGKTTLYSQLAINCALKEKLPAILFSLEMPDIQIMEKMIGQASGVNTDIFYRGSNNDSDFAMANARAAELAESGRLFIDDTPGATLSHIVSESRRIKREKGAVGMVLVDYLTLMKAEKADRNDLAYGLITKGLKNLAKELNCVVVLLTQLNRELEKRTDKRPFPSDSRDTGQIEQDCDYWIGIYREGAYNENADQGFTELLLRLNRHGKSGVVYTQQENGAIYDLNQAQARQVKESESVQHKRYAKGEF